MSDLREKVAEALMRERGETWAVLTPGGRANVMGEADAALAAIREAAGGATKLIILAHRSDVNAANYPPRAAEWSATAALLRALAEGSSDG